MPPWYTRLVGVVLAGKRTNISSDCGVCCCTVSLLGSVAAGLYDPRQGCIMCRAVAGQNDNALGVKKASPHYTSHVIV